MSSDKIENFITWLNVMHSNIILTDQIYSNLVGDRVRSFITSLGKQTPPSSEDGAINRLAQQLLELLQQR